MPLKFMPTNAAQSRPFILGIRDQYLIYLVLLAIAGLALTGNAALAGLPTLPIVLLFVALIVCGYFYFRRIDRQYDAGHLDRMLSYHLMLPRLIRAKPIIHHPIEHHEA